MAVEQLSVRNVSDKIGRVGQVISPAHMNDERNYPVEAGRVKQILDVAVDSSPTTDTVYSVTVLGETVSIVSVGTQATDVTALVTALNANPIVRGIYTAADSATTSVTLTANEFGIDLSFGTGNDVTVDDEGTGELTLTEDTAQSDATQINVGRFVTFDGSGNVQTSISSLASLAGITRHLYDAEQTGIASGDTDLYEDNEEVCVLKTGRMIVDTGATANEGDTIFIETAAGDDLGKPFTASGASTHTLTLTPAVASVAAAARVITSTLVFDTGETAGAGVRLFDTDGNVTDEIIVDTAMDTDAATTVTALAALINAELPASTVIASASGDDLVLTGEVIGNYFEAIYTLGVDQDTGLWGTPVVSYASGADAPETFLIQGTVDGVPFEGRFEGQPSTAKTIVEGLKASLDDNTQAALLTTTEDDSDAVITFANADAVVEFTASDNLTAVQADDTTRLPLSGHLGRWAGPNKIEVSLAL